MKRKFMMLCFLSCALGAHGQSIGPTTLNSTGQSKTSGGNVFEWSVGEMTAITTHTSPTLVITQGVLQPPPPTTGIKQNMMLTDHLKVYPNPARDIVYIQPDFSSSGKMDYLLQDVTGKMIANKQIMLTTGRELQQISLSNCAPGSYVLNIIFTQNEHQYQSAYKIQKLQ